MAYIPQSTGYAFLAAFGALMLVLTYIFARWKRYDTKEGFLAAGRNVGWFPGGMSIAASWIWAPALFVSVQMAYQQGIAGLFWFTVPNVVALALFAVLAPRIRDLMPQGYTLPQYIASKLKSKRVHKMYLVPYFFYQLMAIAVQLFAGGNLVSLLTGIPVATVMPLLAVIALIYTLISGLEASIVTDIVQMSLILCIGAIILPLAWNATGGISAIDAGLGGLAGIRNMFDPGIAFSLGIVTSIGLIAGAISDQQYWQRSFAISRRQLRGSFIFGAILFSIVPIALGTLGFLAANPALGVALPDGVDASMIGVQTIAQYLPGWALVLFVVMLLAGLSSTLDSGLSAASSLWVTDIMRDPGEGAALRGARYAMIGIAIAGLIVAFSALYIPGFGLQHLWLVFNAIAACVLGPTLLSLYKDRLSERGVFWGILLAFGLGIPFFVYGNIIGSTAMIAWSSLGIVAVSTGASLAMPKRA